MERIESYPAVGKESEISTYRLVTDRNGGIWIGTYDRGLIHNPSGQSGSLRPSRRSQVAIMLTRSLKIEKETSG